MLSCQHVVLAGKGYIATMKMPLLLCFGYLLAGCSTPTPAPSYSIIGLWTEVSHQMTFANGSPSQNSSPGVYTLELKTDGSFVDNRRLTNAPTPFIATGTYSFVGTTLHTTYDMFGGLVEYDSQVSNLSASTMTRTTYTSNLSPSGVASTTVINYTR